MSCNNSNVIGNGSSGENSGIVAPPKWDDLRVPVSATTANGSNPPTDALFLNDGNEVPGDAYALSFLSTSQGNLILPDVAVFDTSNDFTFECWLRPTVNTQNNIECMRKQNVFEVDFVGSNQLNLNVIGVGSSTASLQFNRGAWNHIAVVNNTAENQVELYINAQLATTITGGTGDNSNDFHFNRKETLYDVGYVAYWDIALDLSEIALRYASGAGDQLAGNEVGLKGLWELNDGSGTTVVEKTGIALDGEITGGSEGSQWDWIGGHVGNTSAGSRGVILKYFSPDIVNELYFECQMPHRWLEGSDIHAHIHFVPNADGGVGEKITWGLEYSWSEIGSVFGNTTVITNSDEVHGDLVKNKHSYNQIGIIDGTGKGLSSMLCCRIFRDAENVDDTFTNFAGILEFDFHYQIDDAGSRLEFEK